MRVPSWSIPLAQWLRNHQLLYARWVRIYEAKDEDIRRLAAMVSSSPEAWLGRQTRGSVCLIAQSGTTYRGYLWITRGTHLVREVNHVVNVSRDPSGAYIHNVFVMPDSRRMGIFGALVAAAKQWAEARGLSRLYTTIARDNEASERAHRAAGFRTVAGSVTVLRVGSHEWKRVSRPKGTRVVDLLE